MPRLAVGLMFLIVALSSFLSATSQRPASDPQAVAYAAQSIAALTGGTTISDVMLTGSVTWNGSDTGTATLRALGTGESRTDLMLTSGARTEIRDAQTGNQTGQWINPNNASGKFAPQNCQTDAVWFFPALGSLAAGPNVVLAYVGQEKQNGRAVQHIRSHIYQATSPPGSLSQQPSTMDFFLDATTLLPITVMFNAHPDDGANTNLLIKVDFSNYRNVGGALVPMHIRRYLQGNLLVDVRVTGASFNTGLPLSEFSIN